MHTYESIIRQLREDEKIQLLTDIYSFATPEMAALGLPAMQTARLFAKEKDDNTLPTPALLARSFDTELMEQISRHLCGALARRGVNHVMLPGPKAAVGAVSSSLAEDPYLASMMAGAWLKAAADAGMPAFFNHYAPEPPVSARISMASEAAMWERLPNTRLVGDQLQVPFSRALQNGAVTGVLHESGKAMPPMRGNTRMFCRAETGRETVLALRRGELCTQGVAAALRAARLHYDRLHKAVSVGNADQAELDEAIAAGTAISEEEMNDALDKLLGLAHACAAAKPVPNYDPQPAEELCRRALSGSTVLLENKGILPLTERRPIALIGQALTAGGQEPLAIASCLESAGQTVLGYAQGYDLKKERDTELLREAVELADTAELLLVFLQDDRKRYTGQLPADQVALCDRLSRKNIPYILIIAADHPVDLQFIRNLPQSPSAILLAPLRTAGGALHTVRLLLGMEAPEGRLPYTIYDRKTAQALSRGMKRGPFVGYRFFDTAGVPVLYPFGHGLTYTRFGYSKAGTCKANALGCELNFTVTNTGKRRGTEVIQVYMGIRESKLLRPRRELVGFTRVTLEPGQSRVVKLSVEYPALWQEEHPENGTYDVFIGPSIDDIRLHVSCQGGSGLPKADGESLCDYIPSISNIQKENYALEARSIPMKSSLRNIISGIIALVLALGIKVVDVSSNRSSWFLNLAAIALVLGAVIFFIWEVSDRKKRAAQQREAMEAATKEQFAKSDVVAAPTAEALFARATEEPVKMAPRPVVQKKDAFDHFADVVKELTFPVAVQDLQNLGAKRGVIMKKETAAAVFAAMASSRLVLVNGMEAGQFVAFASLIGEYFNCSTGFIDQVDGRYHSESDMLYSAEADGTVFPRPALQTLREAKVKNRDIHIVFLDAMCPEDFSRWFGAYADHIRVPSRIHTVMTKQPGGSTVSLQIPENIWFICNLKANQKLSDLPAYVTELGSINGFAFESVPKTQERIHYTAFRYGQMPYLSERVRDESQTDENTFKKIDRLESYAARYGNYHMGNKLWLGFETYLAVLTQCGLDENEALDQAMAAKLLPGMLCALDGKVPGEERSLAETMDAVFGDDNTALCRRVIKSFEANAQ